MDADMRHEVRKLRWQENRERIAELLRADPVMSNRSVAREVGAHGEVVAKVRKSLEETGEIPAIRRRRGIDGRVWAHKEKHPRTFPYWARDALDDIQATNVQLLLDVRDLLLHVENRLLMQQQIIGDARNGRYRKEQPARTRANGKVRERR